MQIQIYARALPFLYGLLSEKQATESVLASNTLGEEPGLAFG